MATELSPARPIETTCSATSVFDRIVCATARAEEQVAARIAALVAAPAGELTIAPRPVWPAEAVLDELRRRDATLAVVELRERHRALGIAEGSVATVLLHDAPCSVLVTRPHVHVDDWPLSIVVGLDGSIESAAAAAAAWDLGTRLGAPVRAISATEGGHADLELVRRIAPDFETYRDHPVPLLVQASEHAGLVVVGSRGLRGLRALGSVSERVAHRADCPVLVVRSHARPKGAAR